MQACPYDALYIDPASNTAAKCNYCAHRVEAGLEPSCVVVCPTQAILAGDLDDPASAIARTVATQKVVARKVHKGTEPKLFYVGVEGGLLQPTAQVKSNAYLWAERPDDGERPLAADAQRNGATNPARAVYDVAHPAPWGALAGAYLWTKSIAAGTLMVAALLTVLTDVREPMLFDVIAPSVAIFFLATTALILIADLKRPWRFFFLLTKPNPRSWLVWGCYILILYGAAASGWLLTGLQHRAPPEWLVVACGALAIGVAGYTAFLFAQAAARELWQSPLFFWHLIVQALIAGAAVLILTADAAGNTSAIPALVRILVVALILGFAMVLGEIYLPPISEDVKRAAEVIASGALARRFWVAATGVGVIAPVAILATAMNSRGGVSPIASAIAAAAAIAGLWIFEDIWIRAGQAVPLS
jgi:formate-dependent nitrite reductase membrane component NrfD